MMNGKILVFFCYGQRQVITKRGLLLIGEIIMETMSQVIADGLQGKSKAIIEVVTFYSHMKDYH